MIVYKELSSLCRDLGYSARALYAASNCVEKHYHDVRIPKQNGETRLLHVPDLFMKLIQKSIAQNLLSKEEVSIYATAYRPGCGTMVNAAPHAGAAMVMKCDIRKFFDHITYPMIREKVFSEEKYSRENSILLSILCVYSHTVPQGAPTSPAISNIILREFDNRVGTWCEKRGIVYTRYCDDMTFSGEFDAVQLKRFLQEELFKEGFFLNTRKTVVLRKGQRMTVTGVVVNEKPAIPKEYKKELRKDLYYCKRFGAEEHLKHIAESITAEQYLRKLLGRVNYVLSVERNNSEMAEYRKFLADQIRRM